MNCTEARETMLAADLSDLRATGVATPLVAHLDGCARCRSRADAIASGTMRLGELLGARGYRPARRWSAVRVAVVASLPIAAALVVAVGINATRGTDAPPARASSLPVARNVSLTISPGQRATVLKTADPNVTVIWLTPGEGQ